jgi:hypothetical protein
MAENEREGLNLDDEDRLPWLESADDYQSDSGMSPNKMALLAVLGLLAFALAIGAFYWFQNRDGGGANGDGQLIAAQEGDYKVRPADPEGKSFEGSGDASFAASEGKEVDAKIGSGAATEAPAKKGAAVSGDEAAAAPGSALIQLGAFGSTAQADTAWSGFSRRFANIGALPKKITTVSRDGATIYRLNAVAPNAGEAAKVCNSLKAAGEDCIVAK